MKACFDCGSDVVLTDVIHRVILKRFIFWYVTDYITISKYEITYEKIVEYTCRMEGTKFYVSQGIFQKEIKE